MTAQKKELDLVKKLKERERIIKELTEKIAELKRDALTGLENRYAFPEKEEKRKASGKPWSILLLDIDKFKAINDRLGHAAGDAVLQEVGGNLKKLFRTSDAVLRYGGEEFAVILKDAGPQEVLKFKNLFNKKDRRPEIGFTIEYKGKEIPITLSGGVTSFEREEEIESALHRADEALYSSKNNGRNRITWDKMIPKGKVG